MRTHTHTHTHTHTRHFNFNLPRKFYFITIINMHLTSKSNIAKKFSFTHFLNENLYKYSIQQLITENNKQRKLLLFLVVIFLFSK